MNIILLILITMTLTSCGGGGDGATGPTLPVNNGLKITVTSIESSLPSNTLGYPHFLGSPFMSQVNVRVAFDNVINNTTSLNKIRIFRGDLN